MGSEVKISDEIPPFKELPPNHSGRWGCLGAVVSFIATALVFNAAYSNEHPSIGGAGSAIAMITVPVGAFLGWFIGRMIYERKIGK